MPAAMLAGLAMAAGGPAMADSAGAGPYGAATAEVERFNTSMRDLYGQARSAYATGTRPIIVVAGDEVILVTEDGSDARRYTPPEYHRMKAVSHLVLGLVGAVAPTLDGLPDAPDWREGLRTVATEIDALEPALADLGFEGEQEALFRNMLAEGRSYIAQAVELEQPDRAAFETLMARIKPTWLQAGMTATRTQLEMLDGIVRGWQAKMPGDVWARLHVLVTGPRNPRVNNVQTAYFLRLLGEREPGGRVLYTENIFDPDQAMQLLAAVLAERAVGSLVFGDPYRMEVDLLGFAAGAVLDELISGRAVPVTAR